MNDILFFIKTCGRKQYLEEVVSSWKDTFNSHNARHIIFDDSGDPEFNAWLIEQYGESFDVVETPNRNTIQFGQIRHARTINFIFDYLSNNTSNQYFVQVEDDVKLIKPINFDRAIELLGDKVSQVRLSRDDSVFSDWRLAKTLEEKDDHVVVSYMRLWFWGHRPSIFKRDILNFRVHAEKDGFIDSENSLGSQLYDKGYVFITVKDVTIEHIGQESFDKPGTYWSNDGLVHYG